ncbi:MAG: hypothetical protein ACRD4D_05005 [Candidatus Acidiferrales bacterium]
MRRKRKKRVLEDLVRCTAKMPNGRRCEAAAIQHRRHCVFHDPEMRRRRWQLRFPIPYEHPDQIQQLLAEGVEGVKSKKLSSKEAYALGYLATLLMQNRPAVEQEREEMESAAYTTEMQAAVNLMLMQRGEWKEKERQKREREEEEGD